MDPDTFATPATVRDMLSSTPYETTMRPAQHKIRVPLFATRTLNATGQYRVTLSLR